MHLIFYARGVNQHIEVWKMFMQTQMWAWKRRNLKTNKEETALVQGALRPSIFGAWEYIFPEEHYQEVMTLLMGKNDNPSNTIGSDQTLKNKFKLAWLRKAFGAKKLPKWELVPTMKYVETTGVSFHFIGVKKDRREKCKQFGYEQEML